MDPQVPGREEVSTRVVLVPLHELSALFRRDADLRLSDIAGLDALYPRIRICGRVPWNQLAEPVLVVPLSAQEALVFPPSVVADVPYPPLSSIIQLLIETAISILSGGHLDPLAEDVGQSAWQLSRVLNDGVEGERTVRLRQEGFTNDLSSLARAVFFKVHTGH